MVCTFGARPAKPCPFSITLLRSLLIALRYVVYGYIVHGHDATMLLGATSFNVFNNLLQLIIFCRAVKNKLEARRTVYIKLALQSATFKGAHNLELYF